MKNDWIGAGQGSLFIPRLSLFLIYISLFSLFSCAHPPPIPPPPPKPAKIALVLGAGASKGFAHIGVLKILEANRVPVHLIVGTSVGSFVGSLAAYGYSAYDLQKIAFSIERGDIVGLAIPDNGFIRGDRLEEYVNRAVKNTPLEKLPIPFYAVATDIQDGREMVFGRGNTGAAVRASCSIPGIFQPARIGQRMYVDGGVVSPVPVEAARRYGGEVVIAVDISATQENPKPENFLETVLQAVNIMYLRLSAAQLAQADIVIRPKVGHIASADFSRRHEAILEGEKAALEALPKLKELLARLKGEGRL
ncbi:MAG: patatin-like phospholipase family protein [Deltaproteobacteria bacterium]|nr:patatin-like phospholipase family protein [Deltaproteobacteria bacterium]